jgi:hypothetical protein
MSNSRGISDESSAVGQPRRCKCLRSIPAKPPEHDSSELLAGWRCLDRCRRLLSLRSASLSSVPHYVSRDCLTCRARGGAGRSSCSRTHVRIQTIHVHRQLCAGITRKQEAAPSPDQGRRRAPLHAELRVEGIKNCCDQLRGNTGGFGEVRSASRRLVIL